MRFPRFHLSTALIVMIVSGALVGLNVMPNIRAPRAIVDLGSELTQLSPEWRAGKGPGATLEYFPAVYCKHEFTVTTDHYGWPLKVGTKELIVDEYGPRAMATDVELRFFNRDYGYAREPGVRKVSWSLSAAKIAGNVCIAAVLLFLLALFCEIVPARLRGRFKGRLESASPKGARQ